MSKRKEYKCSCGRNAEVESYGVYMCWELYLIDEPDKWKDKYRKDLESRHDRKETT